MCCMLYIFKTRAQDACDSTSLLLLINLLLFNWKVLLRIKLSQVCLACVIQLKTMWQVKKLSNFCYCLDTILCSLKLNNSDLVMICGYIGFNGYKYSLCSVNLCLSNAKSKKILFVLRFTIFLII